MTIMPIGKYKNRVIENIYQTDPQYLAWFVDVVDGFDDLKSAIKELEDFEAYQTAYQSRQENKRRKADDKAWKEGEITTQQVDSICDELFN